jgi:hypothetical protein
MALACSETGSFSLEGLALAEVLAIIDEHKAIKTQRLGATE